MLSKKMVMKLLLFWLMIVTSGCKDDQKPLGMSMVKLNLEATINNEMLPHSDVESKASTSSYSVRYIVDIYETNKSVATNLYKRITNYSSEIDFNKKTTLLSDVELPAAYYKILVWVDYGYETDDTFYDGHDLMAVTIKEPYKGSSDFKDAFAGAIDLDLTSYKDQWDTKIDKVIALERPLAKIEVITTDVEEYIIKSKASTKADISKFTVKLFYSGFFPSSYNVATGKPNDSKTGINFICNVIPIDDHEALLAHDYILVNGIQSGVIVDMIFYNENGEIVNQVGDIAIPIKRGRLTTVKGEFLTRDYKPGIGINPDYDGEINVVIPD